MACHLCLFALAEDVVRILECPGHWVHDYCYIPPPNPSDFQCPVCSKPDTALANGIMYYQKPIITKEERPVPTPTDSISKNQEGQVCVKLEQPSQFDSFEEAEVKERN